MVVSVATQRIFLRISDVCSSALDEQTICWQVGEMGFKQLPKIIVHKKSEERKLLWLTINL